MLPGDAEVVDSDAGMPVFVLMALADWAGADADADCAEAAAGDGDDAAGLRAAVEQAWERRRPRCLNQGPIFASSVR